MRSLLPPQPRPAQRRLTEADAIDIWIARWLRIRRKDLIDRYGCDPRRLYEVWEGTRSPGSREKALVRFAALPTSRRAHRFWPASAHSALGFSRVQGDLFDPDPSQNKQ